MKQKRKIIRKAGKVLLWAVAIFVAIVLIAVLSLQSPRVQQYLTGHVVEYLEKKIDSEVHLGSINVEFPKLIVLKDFYVADRHADTLVYLKRLKADVSMWALLDNRVEINYLGLHGLHARVQRTLPDSTFNFNHILKVFAGTAKKNQAPAKDTNRSNMEITFGDVALYQTKASYWDEVAGIDSKLLLGELSVDTDAINLSEKKIHLDQIDVHQLDGKFILTKEPPSSEPSESQPFDYDLQLDRLNLTDIHAFYQNIPGRQKMDVHLDSLNAKPEEIDISNHAIAVRHMNVAGVQAYYEQDTLATPDSMQVVDSPTKAGSQPWTFQVEQLRIARSDFRYDNFNFPEKTDGLDYQHLNLSDINFQVEDIQYHPEHMSARFNQAQVTVDKTFTLKQLQGELLLDSTRAFAKNLQVKTEQSNIDLNLEARFPSLNALSDNPEVLSLQLDIDKTNVRFADVLYFMPELRDSIPFIGNPKNEVFLTTKLNGSLSQLRIDQLHLKTAETTQINLTGQVAHLSSPEEAVFDLDIARLVTSRTDLQMILPDTMIPQDIQLPPAMAIQGTFKGKLTDFISKLKMKTAYGDLAVDAELNSPADSAINYKATLHTEQFEIQKLLNQPEEGLNNISLTAKIKGKHLKWSLMNADIEAVIDTVFYQNYAYKNVEISANINQQRIQGQASMRDTNLIFTLKTDIDASKDSLHYRANLNLEGMDFQALNLTSEDVRAQGNLNINFTGDKLNYLNGTAGLRDVVIVKNNERYPVDSLFFVSITGKQKTDISLESDFLSGYFKGNINLADVLPAMKKHINQYYKLISEEEIDKPVINQDFTFNINLKDPDLLSDVLLKDLEEFTPGRITGSYDSRTYNLEMEVYIPSFTYNQTTFDSLSLVIDSDRDSLNYSFRVKEINNATLLIENPILVGNVSNDQVDISLDITNDNGYNNLLLSGQLTSLGDAYQFQFKPKGVIFDNETWSVPDSNSIQFGPKGLLVQHLELHRREQSISLESKKPEINAPLKLTFRNFHLEELAQAVEARDSLLRGTLDGSVEFQNLGKNPNFIANLNMNQLAYQTHTLGNLSVNANNKTENIIDVEANLGGSGNDVQISGSYETANKEKALDFTVDVSKLQMSSLEAFLRQEVRDMSGYASGKFNIRGSTDEPQVQGQLTFREAGFTVKQLGSRFHLNNEKVTINNDGFHFDQFTLLDLNEQKAIISGDVFMRNFGDLRFALNIDINRFNILNKPQQRNTLFYGQVTLNSQIQVRGNINKPKLIASAQILEGSDLTVVLPPEEPTIRRAGGIDAFVDVDQQVSPILTRDKGEVVARSKLKGLDLNANLNVGRETSLKIILEDGGGDYVQVRGDADLIFGIDPSGKITLSGRYEIFDGEYKLVYRTVVRRSFDLLQGSYIIWSGDPLEAQVKFNAEYQVVTSALPLVQDQLRASSQAELNRFKKELPFIVRLNMEGELLAPEIDFDINLPPQERGALGGQVQARLNQLNQAENISELNKQVFSLLVLGRFLPKDPFSTQGGTASTATRTSVAKILNTQLEKLSDKYIKGVDLDLSLDSYEDYSTGEARGRTELNIGIQKALLDERLRVRVGGNVDLEGPRRTEQQASDLVGDLSLEYVLTEEGSWRLRAYRKSHYEGVIEGEIVKTGMSILFSKNYDTFRSLFRDNKKKKEEQNK